MRRTTVDQTKSSANGIEESTDQQHSQYKSGPLPPKLKREFLFHSSFDIIHKTYKVTHFDSRLALMMADTLRCALRLVLLLFYYTSVINM